MFYKIKVHASKCQGCSMCINNCPINQQIEPNLKYGEGPKTKDVIHCLKNGRCMILHPEKCINNNGGFCNICYSSCPKQCIELVVD
ncbi:MAG: hypothetical protein ACTSRW_09180 [Candidatus Helarchaeota archaeon]